MPLQEPGEYSNFNAHVPFEDTEGVVIVGVDGDNGDDSGSDGSGKDIPVHIIQSVGTFQHKFSVSKDIPVQTIPSVGTF